MRQIVIKILQDSIKNNASVVTKPC